MNATGILWCDFTWNFFSGCKRLSAACHFCYADDRAERYRGTPAFPHGFDLTVRPHKLGEPAKLLRTKGPSLIFCESMSDIGLADEELSPEEIERLKAAGYRDMDHVRDAFFRTIAETPEHRYQVLTKRPETLERYFASHPAPGSMWLGVTVENAKELHRLDVLRRFRERGARVLFVSIEPLLSANLAQQPAMIEAATWLDWMIIGGESGTHFANPAHASRFLVTKTAPLSPERVSEGTYAVKRAALEAVRALLELKRGREVLDRAEAAVRAEGFQGLAGGVHDTSVRVLYRSLLSHATPERPLTAALEAVRACSVPTFFKQWGGPKPESAGREVDGRTYDEMPIVPGAMPERRAELHGAATAALARKRLPIAPA